MKGEARARNTDPVTSHEAAEIVNETKTNHKHAEIVYLAMLRFGKPAIMEEICNIITEITPVQAKKRFSTCEQLGWIRKLDQVKENSGGFNCHLWEIVP